MSTASNNDVLGILPGVGATASQNSPDLQNPYGRGVKVYINMVSAGTGSVTFTIAAKDPGSGQYVPLLSSAAIVASGLTTLTVYPGIAAVANVSASDVLPRTWRVQAVANNANPTSYFVGASVIV